MKHRFLILAVIAAVAIPTGSAAAVIEPSATYLFAQKDSASLYLDIYDPAEGSQTQIDGRMKPTILFMFGGGFTHGSRDDEYFNKWFRLMTQEGYRIVSIDYRVGLKGIKGAGVNMKFIKALRNAINIAVEDLFTATNFIIDNAAALNIDPSNIVISGSSAGAITAMQAEWEICNGRELARVLPEGFNYTGVMSFSGAVFSDKGAIKYASEPCPTLLFHGTEDKIVPYNKIQMFRLCFSGANDLAKALKKRGSVYRIYRYKGHGHEISADMEFFVDKETEFIEENVMKGIKASSDSLVSDSALPIPDWAKGQDYKNLYD